MAISNTLVKQEDNWFQEHLHDIERNDKDASKPVTRQLNLSNHSSQDMAVCSLSLHLGNLEGRKTIEQKFIFQISTLDPHGINELFFIQLIYSCLLVTIFPPIARLHFLHTNSHITHNSPNHSDEGLTLETSAFKLFTVVNLRFQLNSKITCEVLFCTKSCRVDV